VKWNVWRSAVAGALIGLVEAAGLAAVRPALRRPLGVVRPADRLHLNPLARLGVWFLDPLPDPRPHPSDQRCRHHTVPISVVVPRTWPAGEPS
jgi:hypothetical protein